VCKGSGTCAVKDSDSVDRLGHGFQRDYGGGEDYRHNIKGELLFGLVTLPVRKGVALELSRGRKKVQMAESAKKKKVSEKEEGRVDGPNRS